MILSFRRKEVILMKMPNLLEAKKRTKLEPKTINYNLIL